VSSDRLYDAATPWAAERDVSRELARALIEEQFPELMPVEIEPLGCGWDSAAYLVNCEVVFRLPQRRLGAECLKNEARVLPALKMPLPLPIPRPKFIGRATERFPWLFLGHPRLMGDTACTRALDESERAASAQPLAEFLAALHSIGPGAARALVAPLDLLGRLDPKRRIPQVQERLAELSQMRLIPDAEPYCRLIDQTARARAPQAIALVHGDLYVRHLLVDERARLCGIIDWGDLHLGDVAVDLSIAHTFLPPSAHDRFRRAYGLIDDATWRLARFRALQYGTYLAQYAYAVGDAHLLREALLTLGWLR